MIRYLVFDFDGVLVDSNAIKRDAYYQIFATLKGADKVVDSCLETCADGNRLDVLGCICQELQNKGMLAIQRSFTEIVADYIHQYGEICETNTITCSEIAGVSVCLPRLSQRFALYIDSTTLEEPLQRVVRQRHWEPYFRAVLGSPRTKVENLNWILEQEGIAGNEVVFVGDGMRDLVAARACGCHFIGVRNPFNDFDTQDLIMVDDWYELEKVLAQFEA
jgi:phosphoglycolate phosphatase-like HAD superfamily hydrolase